MTIYDPREDSFLLQKYVKEYAFGKVLEIGTGSGILAVEAAQSHRVTSVLAVDIQKEVIAHCKKTIGNKKITFQQSNLFENVKGRFDTIIFNPPYLPADKRDPDVTLDGGKHGYETIELFLHASNKYLTENGKILLLFSSLSKKNKIDECIAQNLFTAKLIDQQHISFETLYVYCIEKSVVLKEIEHKKITPLRYFAKGRRGLTYLGTYKNKKMIIKIPNPESDAVSTIQFEEKWLKKMNALKIGPTFYYATESFLVMEYIKGLEIFDFLEKSTKQNIKKVIRNLLKQMLTLDNKGILKQEMTHPYKHIIVRKNKPILIDFERCRYTERSRNINQFLQFLTSYKVAELLQKKGIVLDKEKINAIGKEYSKIKKICIGDIV
jgi:release factor glutamine methyltransferase